MTDIENKFIDPSSDVDLTNCDREPIHILGRVQSFGTLISVSSDWIINHASLNIDTVLDMPAHDIIGCHINDFFSQEAVHAIRSRLQLLSGQDAVERIFGLALNDNSEGEKHDIAVHGSGRSIIIEIEPHDKQDRQDYLAYVRPMIDRASKADTLEGLFQIAARQLRTLIGFNRVMVYRFGTDDSGTVVAESLTNGLESFKDLRFPASDIPKQARALYALNQLRIIADVNDEGIMIYPTKNPDGEPLDLSMSSTRAVSPIHLEYLKNMGVEASLSISILKQGKLWGLFACHHDSPRFLSYEIRSAAELFAQLFSFVLEQKENIALEEERKRGQVLHDQLMAQLAEGTAITDNFETVAEAIKSAIPFDGAVAWIDGRFESVGKTPTKENLMSLIRFLNTTAASSIYRTHKLSQVFPSVKDFYGKSSGLLALPVSRSPRDYIILFRDELVQSVNWAGDPNKPVLKGPNGVRLNPRKSFEAWQETVREQSQPWTELEARAAEALRVTLLEVILRISDETNKERAKSQERQEILIAELNHRVRNILNLIRGLIAQSKSETQSIDDFIDVVGGRIQALARAHDQITKENWNSASLYDLILTEGGAYTTETDKRFHITGPNVLIKPTAFTTLSLVIHELMTNAAKYGSLSDKNGHVAIDLNLEDDGHLTLHWKEVGGPPISEVPKRQGFGTTVIERAIPFELKGKSEISYNMSGLQANLSVPSTFIAGTAGEPKTEEDTSDTAVKTDLMPKSCLVVEDNMIIAMDVEDMLTDLGVENITVLNSVHDALEFLGKHSVEFGVLDINLGMETSEKIAERMVQQQTPFLFTTGYGETIDMLGNFPNTHVLQKPYNKSSLAEAITSFLSS